MVATVDLRQRQWLLAVAVSGSAREKERKMQRKGEGEWRGQGKTWLKFGFHAPGARWRRAQTREATRRERSAQSVSSKIMKEQQYYLKHTTEAPFSSHHIS